MTRLPSSSPPESPPKRLNRPEDEVREPDDEDWLAGLSRLPKMAPISPRPLRWAGLSGCFPTTCRTLPWLFEVCATASLTPELGRGCPDRGADWSCPETQIAPVTLTKKTMNPNLTACITGLADREHFATLTVIGGWTG